MRSRFYVNQIMLLDMKDYGCGIQFGISLIVGIVYVIELIFQKFPTWVEATDDCWVGWFISSSLSFDM